MNDPLIKILRIGSRGSDLALWQARYVAEHSQGPTEIVILKTRGDQIQHLSLDKVEGKGFFTKEIEEAVLSEHTDVAVHSFKDLPTEEVAGLTVAAVPLRAPVRDVLVMQKAAIDSEQRWGLPLGARVGTSSLRRKAHILSLRPDLDLIDLRGNVPTRFNKVNTEELDAVILAEAGLLRLDLMGEKQPSNIALHPLPIDDVCPAPAQGALAIQIRVDDEETRCRIQHLHHAPTADCVAAERMLLARFGGGCHLPLGASCQPHGQQLQLRALVASPDGSERIEASATGADPQSVAELVHQQLSTRGAEKYL